MNNNPIGIFDSGVGGLTVWKELQKLLPHENIIYLADSENCPYGSKSHQEIISLSIKNVDFLINKKCKLIIVACNTATAASIEILRKKYSIPFVGMEPAIKPAALNTNTGKIGVLATKGTFEGRLFKETSKKYAERVHKVIQIGDGLVELVESGEINSLKAELLLKKYINPMVDAEVDQIVLGCTHYPFFTSLIKKIIPKTIQLINPAPAIALRTETILNEKEMANNNGDISLCKFYSSGEKKVIKQLLKDMSGIDYEIISAY